MTLDGAGADVSIETTRGDINGSIRSSFQLAGDDAQRRNKRLTLTLGNGSAHVELESFGGAIALRRPGEPQPGTEQRRRSRERDHIDPPDLR